MPKVIAEREQQTYNRTQNRDVKRARYIVEKIMVYPGDAKGFTGWYHMDTFYREREAVRHASKLLGKVRVTRVEPNEIYVEGWEKE